MLAPCCSLALTALCYVRMRSVLMVRPQEKPRFIYSHEYVGTDADKAAARSSAPPTAAALESHAKADAAFLLGAGAAAATPGESPAATETATAAPASGRKRPLPPSAAKGKSQPLCKSQRVLSSFFGRAPS